MEREKAAGRVAAGQGAGADARTDLMVAEREACAVIADLMGAPDVATKIRERDPSWKAPRSSVAVAAQMMRSAMVAAAGFAGYQAARDVGRLWPLSCGFKEGSAEAVRWWEGVMQWAKEQRRIAAASEARARAMADPVFAEGFRATTEAGEKIGGTWPENPHAAGSPEAARWALGAEQARIEGASPDSWRDGGAGMDEGVMREVAAGERRDGEHAGAGGAREARPPEEGAVGAGLAKIRNERLRGFSPSEERARQSVIASQRIAGIDARPWVAGAGMDEGVMREVAAGELPHGWTFRAFEAGGERWPGEHSGAGQPGQGIEGGQGGVVGGGELYELARRDPKAFVARMGVDEELRLERAADAELCVARWLAAVQRCLAATTQEELGAVTREAEMAWMQARKALPVRLEARRAEIDFWRATAVAPENVARLVDWPVFEVERATGFEGGWWYAIGRYYEGVREVLGARANINAPPVQRVVGPALCQTETERDDALSFQLMDMPLETRVTFRGPFGSEELARTAMEGDGAAEGDGDDSDPLTEALRVVVEYWPRLEAVVEGLSFGDQPSGKGITASAAIDTLRRKDGPPDGFDDLREALGELTRTAPGRLEAHAVGVVLWEHRRRVIDGCRLTPVRAAGKSNRWTVEVHSPE